jgi:hypothetical protein
MYTDDTLLPPSRPLPEHAEWDTPEPSPRPRSRGRLVAVIVAIAAVVGSIAVVGAVAQSSSPWYPDEWDDRVAPIAREVSRLRGLEFKHTVPVRFLTDEEFEDDVGIDDAALDESDREAIERSTALLRSFGLIAGDVDLRDAVDSARTSGILAYYNPDIEEIVVRGTSVDVAHRVTLAHELVHVLQDQHFDLAERDRAAEESDTGDAGAFEALVEGDASRIEDDYVSRLSEAEQSDYEAQSSDDQERYADGSADIPEIVELTFAAPYIFGPSTIRMLLAEGGNAAVDRALRGPPPASRMFIEPGVLDGPAVADPDLPPGATSDEDSEPVSPLDAYLMMAATLDTHEALRAADLITGGRGLHYRDPARDVDCYAIAFRARPGTEPQLRDALTKWEVSSPEVGLGQGGGTTVQACDPGKEVAGPPEGRLEDAVQLLALRSQLTAEIAESDVPPEAARCVARLFVRRPGMVERMLESIDGEPTGADAEAIQSAAQEDSLTCALDDSSGIP